MRQRWKWWTMARERKFLHNIGENTQRKEGYVIEVEGNVWHTSFSPRFVTDLEL